MGTVVSASPVVEICILVRPLVASSKRCDVEVNGAEFVVFTVGPQRDGVRAEGSGAIEAAAGEN